MCGRFVRASSIHEVLEQFDLLAVEARALGSEELPPPRYNIAPTDPVLAVTADAEGGDAPRRTARWMRWGFAPPGAKRPLFNARDDQLLRRPIWTRPFERSRCVIPADGFYEWPKHPDGTRGKQARYITRRDGRLMAFAGLRETRTERDTGEVVDRCTIITTSPNELIAAIPHERMPVILEPDDLAAWLDPARREADTLRPLLRPLPAERMRLHPVGPFVNRRFDDERCIAPVHDAPAPEEPGLFG